MTNLEIRQCTIAELEAAPNLAALLEEYAQESALEGFPHPAARIELYKQLEQSGCLTPFAAYLDDTLIGFVHVVCSLSPKYGVGIATIESIFVAAAYRKTGAGLKLRSAAEQHAQSCDAVGVIISAPIGGTLEAVLDNSTKYKPCNKIFYYAFPKQELAVEQVKTAIASMSDDTIAKVEAFEKLVLSVEQVPLHTHHTLHAGVYVRTIEVEPDIVLTGVHIKIPTILIASGDFDINTDAGDLLRLQGSNMVLPASAGRKQVVRTHAPSRFSMIFHTLAKTVEEAEREFTDAYDQLVSHKAPNTNSYTITGE